MPRMLSKLYAALIKAGAGDAKARAVAPEVAGWHDPLSSLEASFDRIDALMATLLRLTIFNAVLVLVLAIKVFFFWG